MPEWIIIIVLTAIVVYDRVMLERMLQWNIKIMNDLAEKIERA